ncbi:3-dehydroquinate synthase [Bacillus carboniphilus]|uniref:3-dehydroquinate synthase n=1 Tax=Bacillus carboniphilus TaxID=86663 RepID=A0ABP3GKB3_9BACI
MRKLSITTDTSKYNIFIGNQITDFIVEDLSRLDKITKVMVICDKNISNLYLESFISKINQWTKVIVQIVPNGEYAKSFTTYEECMKKAIQEGLDRHSLVVAFGGGAVGDLAGFVAATFMRGIRFVQIPTTLLAHDSAVGGKTAINHPLGKNMVGAFHQPEAVYYDLQYLQTLPVREKLSGFAELIKHGLIGDRALLDRLTAYVKYIDFQTISFWEEAIEKGIKVKARIVEQDTKEKSVRAFLNFGHTLGHAIENLSEYQISHGEAVLKGMMFALNISDTKHSLAFSIQDFKEWFIQLGYDPDIPSHMSNAQLLSQMKRDKKVVGGAIKFILLKDIEQPYITEMNDEELIDFLNKLSC